MRLDGSNAFEKEMSRQLCNETSSFCTSISKPSMKDIYLFQRAVHNERGVAPFHLNCSDSPAALIVVLSKMINIILRPLVTLPLVR